jgi:hypothetical protein
MTGAKSVGPIVARSSAGDPDGVPSRATKAMVADSGDTVASIRGAWRPSGRLACLRQLLGGVLQSLVAP